MKAVVKTKPAKGIEILDVPIPKPAKDEVLVKVKFASICGTDLHIYHWNEWADNKIKTPRILGHEFVGEVIETGKFVRSVKTGDYVCAETHISCGRCYECQTGLAHICQNLEVFGIDRNGAFAEYAVIPESVLWKVPKEIPLEVAAFCEPIGNAVHTVFSTSIAALKILITGCGPIGLASIAISKACGAAFIIAVDINDYRLKLAKKLGANITINASKTDVIDEILKSTAGHGVDVVFEMSGSGKALQQSLKVLRNGGHISLLGIPDKPIEINTSDDIILKELTIKGIHGREIFKTWHQTTNLIISGFVDFCPIITHKMPLEKFDDAIALMDSGNCGKVILFP